MIKNETIDDVTSLIIDYQLSPEEEKLNIIIEKIAPYIRNYPQFAFRKSDEDIKSDFFLYVYERFDGFLKKYDPKLSKFSTYLSIKLKNHFLNFLRREKSMNKIEVVSYEVDSVSEVIFQESENVWKVSERQKLNNKASEIERDFFNSKKNPFRYICTKLYYFDFFNEEDFLLLKKLTKKKYSEILSEINQFAEDIAKRKRNKLKYEFRLNKVHHKMMTISKKIESLSKESEKGEQRELQKKLNVKKNEILRKYNSISTRPTMRSVAKILSVDTSKVQNVINYFKSSVKKRDYRK